MADTPRDPDRPGTVDPVVDDAIPGFADRDGPMRGETPLAPPSSVSPSAPRGRGSHAARELNRLLQDARARLLRGAVAEVVAGAGAGVAGGVVVAAIVVGVVPFSLALKNALLAGIVGAGLVGASLVLWRRALPLRHDLVVGAALESAMRRRGRDVGDTVRGALELRDVHDDERDRRSRALCDAHIARTTATLRDGDVLASLPAVALERAVPTLLTLALTLAVLLGWAALSPDDLRRRLARLVDDVAAEAALAERAAQSAPLVTDLKLTLRFPAYMALRDEVIPGAAGDVTAPAGTEVLVEGRADRPVRGAALLLTGGATELALQAEVTDRRQLTARFVVEHPGAWRFRLEEEDGDVEVDPVAHKILVKSDAAPVVRLEEPRSDRVVQVDEEVSLAFSAEDDVGITKIRVIVKRQGLSRPPFEKDLQDAGGLRSTRGRGAFSVADTGARPGEVLAVTIEALDNDTVRGPNVGRSTTRLLTVFSAAKHHEEVIARLDELLGQMVEVLGDELEAPFADVESAPAPQQRLLSRHRQLAPRAAAMMKVFDETLTAIARDERADDGVRRALANMRLELSRREQEKRDAVERTPPPVDPRAVVPGLWRHLVEVQRALVHELEKDILYLEDLVQRERVREAQKLVADMKRAQQDLKQLLQQYKESGDPAIRDALLDEIQRMQQQLAALAARLGELRREIPDEHLNEDAFKGDEMFQKASTLDEMIEEGRLDDAAAALEQMLEQTEKMVEELDKAEDTVGGDEHKELHEKMRRFADELEALEEAQKEQMQETEQLLELARKRIEEKLKAKLDKALAEAKKKIEKASSSLSAVPQDGLTGYEEEDIDAAKARTADAQKALSAADLEDALRAIEDAEVAARSAEGSLEDRRKGRWALASRQTRLAEEAARTAADALREARRMLEEAMPDPSSMMDARDRDRLGKQADRQEQLREQAQKLAQLMEDIGKEAPIFGPDHKQSVEQAQEAMQRAGRQLKGQAQGRGEREGLRGARQSQAEALQRLASLQEAMQQRSKGSDQGGGLPLPLPSGGAPGSQREGQRGHSKEEVKIPDGSDFKVKDAFRKDILDAMREGAPQDWAGEVKKYYEELIK